MYNAVASALRSGPRGLYYGIIFRLTSGCSAVASALRSGRRGRWFESTHPDHLFSLIRQTLTKFNEALGQTPSAVPRPTIAFVSPSTFARAFHA